jgi:ubiquinone/menaquinone biosynthesis C-methylase UbiE
MLQTILIPLILLVMMMIWFFLGKETKWNIVSSVYDIVLKRVEQSLKQYRSRFVPYIYGHCLDVAVGTGGNIEFYKNAKSLREVTLIDISKGMLSQAKQKAKQMLFNDQPITHFVRTAVENMPFENSSFDSILSIDVFCSVTDPEQGLKELVRVLKPGGRIVFVEHFRTRLWYIDLCLMLLTVLFMYPLLGISMVRKTDEFIKKQRELSIEEEGKLNHSFQYFICKKIYTK